RHAERSWIVTATPNVHELRPAPNRPRARPPTFMHPLPRSLEPGTTSPLLLQWPTRREQLEDEMLQTLPLLERNLARQQQDAHARLDAGHDLAVLEVREPRHDLDRDRAIAAQCDDPILATELVSARVVGLDNAAAPGSTGEAAGEPARGSPAETL